MLKEALLLNDSQDSQALHGSRFSPGLKQLMVLARIRAQVVLPTPLGPVNKNAWASWLFLMAFFKVLVMWLWPTTVLKVEGLYFLAETIKLSIKPAIFSVSKVLIFEQQ
jgi:hypothetical protein